MLMSTDIRALEFTQIFFYPSCNPSTGIGPVKFGDAGAGIEEESDDCRDNSTQ